MEPGRPMDSQAKATLAKTLRSGSSRKSWKTQPIWRRSAGTFHDDRRVMSRPAMCTDAGGRQFLAQQQPQKGRFPGAGGADQKGEFAARDLDARCSTGRVSGWRDRPW